MPPLLFERLILRLCDWPAWRARALRDALDAAPRGLLPLGGLVAAVAAASRTRTQSSSRSFTT